MSRPNYQTMLNFRNRLVDAINDEMKTECRWQDGCKTCQCKGFCDMLQNFISNLDKHIISEIENSK